MVHWAQVGITNYCRYCFPVFFSIHVCSTKYGSIFFVLSIGRIGYITLPGPRWGTLLSDPGRFQCALNLIVFRTGPLGSCACALFHSPLRHVLSFHLIIFRH